MKVMVLGASGMLGHEVARTLAEDFGHEVYGTVRNGAAVSRSSPSVATRLLVGVDVLDGDGLVSAMARVRPEVVINCIGLVKQLSEANDPLSALPINAMLPHRLVKLCALSNARLVHISTDCVYSGSKGSYVESDVSDAKDLYGKSKFIGEVSAVNAVTLRTSIVGHDLFGATEGLVEWFLSQNQAVRGFTKAIFSGLTTRELALVIGRHVLTDPELHGLYHVSVDPISKFDLLSIINEIYGKLIDIEPDDGLVIDRSLDSSRFRDSTGYMPPSWRTLIEEMYRRSRFV